MNIEEYRDFCLSLPATTEDFPFDENTLAFRLANKMYALCNISNFESFNLKCDPEKAILLRETFHCVRPGFHMNKKHWNTIDLDGSVSKQQLQEWIKHSYDCVFQSLSKKIQQEIATTYDK